MSLTTAVERIIDNNKPRFFSQGTEVGRALNVAASASIPDDLVNFPQGVGQQYTRTTDKIALDYLVCDYRLRVEDYLAFPVRPVVRVILFQWHPDSASVLPTYDKILLDTTSGWLSIMSRFVFNQSDDITILYDRVHKITSHHSTFLSAANYYTPNDREDYGKIKIAGNRFREIDYNGSLLTGTDHVFIWAFTEADQSWLLDFSVKMQYHME